MTYDYPNAKVLNVVDGDTIDVAIDYGFRLVQTHRVRLAGIDAPEINAVGTAGEEARDWLRGHLPVGCAVHLRTEKPADKFGRYLAWVFAEGDIASTNDQLIDTGHAVAYDGGKR